mgnify:CR=1 FL=1
MADEVNILLYVYVISNAQMRGSFCIAEDSFHSRTCPNGDVVPYVYELWVADQQRLK